MGQVGRRDVLDMDGNLLLSPLDLRLGPGVGPGETLTEPELESYWTSGTGSVPMLLSNQMELQRLCSGERAR